MINYDPNNVDDPLRHKYLQRKSHEGEYVMPINEKIANGLGVNSEQLDRIRADGVHVERVPTKIRHLLRMMG